MRITVTTEPTRTCWERATQTCLKHKHITGKKVIIYKITLDTVNTSNLLSFGKKKTKKHKTLKT